MSGDKSDLRIGGHVGGSVNTGRVGGDVSANEKDKPNNIPWLIASVVAVAAITVISWLLYVDVISSLSVGADGVKVDTE